MRSVTERTLAAMAIAAAFAVVPAAQAQHAPGRQDTMAMLVVSPAALRADLERKQTRMRLVPFIDPLDVRYRRYDQVPRPVARAPECRPAPGAA